MLFYTFAAFAVHLNGSDASAWALRRGRALHSGHPLQIMNSLMTIHTPLSAAGAWPEARGGAAAGGCNRQVVHAAPVIYWYSRRLTLALFEEASALTAREAKQ